MVRVVSVPLSLVVLLTYPAWAVAGDRRGGAQSPSESVPTGDHASVGSDQTAAPTPSPLPRLRPMGDTADESAEAGPPLPLILGTPVPAISGSPPSSPPEDLTPGGGPSSVPSPHTGIDNPARLRPASDGASSAPGDLRAPVIVSDDGADPVQPIGIGVTGWVQTWPAYNHHLVLSMAAPMIQAPWQLLIDAVPTVGTGSASVGYPVVLGPLLVLPTLGLRYHGVTGTSTEAFLFGPQARVGFSLPLQSWLAVTGKMVYAPWLQAMNKTGAGSYVEISGGLSAIVGRMTYSLGYLGMQADPVAAGVWPSGGAFLGGPTAAVAFSI